MLERDNEGVSGKSVLSARFDDEEDDEDDDLCIYVIRTKIKI